jgi:dGTP triphosphohydrolase
MTIREELEQREREILAPVAAKSADTKGRMRPEAEDPIRPSFQRDRDRVIHTKAFRRLKHKTQVFFSPTGDHYRTRLTHTLEVSQIARTIAKVLRLHEELTEAIALGHDLGHTPFGHAGERVLSAIVPGEFNHYEQSLRIVDVLENDRRGLNLTWEVRDGIARHSKGKSGLPVGAPPEHRASTIEGQIARVADIIAYVNHDTDDDSDERRHSRRHAGAPELSLRIRVRKRAGDRRVHQSRGHFGRAVGEGARASAGVFGSADGRGGRPGCGGAGLPGRHDRPLRGPPVRAAVHS